MSQFSPNRFKSDIKSIPFLIITDLVCFFLPPILTGVGYGMLMVSGVVCIYYNVIMAWSLYYLVMSFTLDTLPWASCDNWWNTESCMLRQLKTSHELSNNATAATPTAANIAELVKK